MTKEESQPIIYNAFGDGSSGETGTYYGLVLIPENALANAMTTLADVKIRYGATPEASLHCRELFSDIARKTSVWRHLARGPVIELCSEILRQISAFHPVYVLSFMPVEHYPKRFRLRGKYGPPDIVHDVDDKWRTLWLYQIAATKLDPAQMIPPSDPRVTTNPKNQPWWRTEAELSAPSYRVRKVYLDREDTTITWFSKKFKWITVARDFVIRGSLGRSHLPIQMNQTPKHPLLDLADLFVWSVARAFSKDPVKFIDFEGEVDAVLFGYRGEEWVVGGQIAPSRQSDDPR